MMDEVEEPHVPARVVLKVQVVSVKNLPANLSKNVRVKVYLSKKVTHDLAAIQWQLLGETKAWCPKRWKHHKKAMRTNSGHCPKSKSIHQAIDGINPEYHRDFHFTYHAEVLGNDYQVKLRWSVMEVRLELPRRVPG